MAMLLLANQGVSFLPQGMAKAWPELCIKTYLGPTDFRQVGIACSSSRPLSPALQMVLQSFKQK
ncbi:hypothetical protein [Endozoicomonas ascidiicola]|uniref:hypothetical protein n=1 Tax=Endozoicomonas ascidiicola TaxID=1698521 RepID=UPI0034541E09